jgi:hypothetical protein
MVLGQGNLLTLLPLRAPTNPSPSSLICCMPCSSQAAVKMLLGQRAWGLSGPLRAAGSRSGGRGVGADQFEG